MGWFDDDFYSTRVKRKTRREFRFGRSKSYDFGRDRYGSMFKVALVSSLASSLVVAIVFTLFLDHGGGGGGRAQVVSSAPIMETSERTITASAKIRPAVVSIINRTKASDPDEEESLENASLGSGVIFEKKDGKARIITNAHVLENAAEVQVVLVDGKMLPAKIVGKDTITDLAVLETDAAGIDVVATIGDSEALREGETVIAIGNPLGFGDSLTSGIVSNLHRVIPISLNQNGVYDWEEEVIQTDAAINAGNSGGALVDLNGKLVGINSMKVADMGVEGIGFAIPINDAMPVIAELLENGKVLRPYLGIYSMNFSSYLDSLEEQKLIEEDPEAEQLPEDQKLDEIPVPDGVKKGVLVLEAVGPAKEAGLKLNDLIVKFDGQAIDDTIEMRKYLYNRKKIGESLTVSYYRDGKLQELTVKLTEKSEDSE
ncbi:S1C family serine protease [Cohnella thailandensis]|uniref:Trypsin-like peptidase domain-containing protein n=1 Tax=Cohnella thailandensis TaxID=557557 RepID=A0A841SQ50_9BACL|nr:trypsin-like peptidase domain-containing protein [Cohnella thailandensis]MBB6634084.1 trypsin-like peptidase domain-containing protein [Cohnella thailandensis]MBP1972424.1 serine protease Do [Cohnella thailandensis]